MKRIALCFGVLILSACGNTVASEEAAPAPEGVSPTATASNSSEPTTASPSSPAPAATGTTSTTGTTITVRDSEFGPMLVDDRGQAIYLFDLETTTKPRCYGACAEAWPPVLTDGDPVAKGEARGALLGTTKRTDGTTQVTYNGHPLYFYADEAPGQVLCHNVFEYEGLWLVVQPNGDAAPV